MVGVWLQIRESNVAKALVLRTCNSDLTSWGGFQWPSSGKVIAPDWDPKPECGNGLHGALYGEGDGSLFNWRSAAKWLVVEVELESVVDLGGKVKFPECEVVYCGDRIGACKYLQENGCTGRAIGYIGTSTFGYRGSNTSGEYGIILSKWFDGNRCKTVVRYVGEDGIEASFPYYKLNKNGKSERLQQ